MAEKPLTWWRRPPGKHKRVCLCLCVNEITSALICAGRETFGCYSIIISPNSALQNTCTMQTCDHADIAKPAQSVAALETVVRSSSHNYVTFGEKKQHKQRCGKVGGTDGGIGALDLFQYFP